MISINNIKKIAYSAIQKNITSKKDLTNYFRSNKPGNITITSLIKEYNEISKVKSKRSSFKVKPVPNIKNRLNIHPDSTRIKSSIDSLNSSRNSFAHGDPLTSSFEDIRKYFNDSVLIIKILDEIVN